MSDKNLQAERERMVLDIKVKLQVQCFLFDSALFRMMVVVLVYFH